MRRLRGICIGCGLVVVAVLVSPVKKTEAFEFSAQRIVKDRDKLSTTQIYASDGRWRMEYARPEGGAMAAIVRGDKDRAWLLFSRMRRYVEVEITDNLLLMVNEKMDGEISRELIGFEDLNGFPVELFEVTVEREGRREQYYQWVTQPHRFAIKTISKDGDHRVEYRNVNFGKQPDLYFELPIRYGRGNARGPQNPN